VQSERIGKRDQVIDDLAGLVVLDRVRLVGAAEAALVRRDDVEVPVEIVELVPPGAVRFGKP
jgi:hypothetical protein